MNDDGRLDDAGLREVARRLGRKHIAFGTMLDVAPKARHWAGPGFRAI